SNPWRSSGCKVAAASRAYRRRSKPQTDRRSPGRGPPSALILSSCLVHHPNKSARRQRFERAKVGSMAAGGADRIDDDVVGASRQMVVEASAQLRCVAPHHQRIDQPIAAVATKVVVSKTKRAEMGMVGR